MKKQYYIQESDLVEQFNVWRNSAEKVENRVVPEKLAEQIYIIADHLLTHKRFVRYPYHEKEEMKQEAVVKCLHNLKNIDTAKGTIFNYFTRTCWTAFITFLAKYYKGMNERRQLLLDALTQVEGQKESVSTAYLQQLMKDIQQTIDMYKDGGADEED